MTLAFSSPTALAHGTASYNEPQYLEFFTMHSHDTRMDDHQTQTIIATLTGLFGGGGLVALIGSLMNRRKTSAETVLIKANADNVVIGSALEFVKAIREEAADLRKRAGEQEERAETLERKIKVLEDHIILQVEIIQALRAALKEYNPEHPLLQRPIPPTPPL